MPRFSLVSRLAGSALVASLALVGSASIMPTTAHAAQFLSLYHRPDLKWYTIETEHFMVHYPVSKNPEKTAHNVDGTWAARKVAKVSEDYWEPMCREFDYYLQEKVHIVVLEQYDQLQGFTIPARNWVEISGNPGGSFYRLRGRSEWFSNVLVHEFAHVVSLKRNAAMSENVPAIATSILYNNDAIGLRNSANGGDLDSQQSLSVVISDRTEPWWWTEGGAEYWSSRSGYNWWTNARDRHIRNTILEDRALTYQQWKSIQQSLSYGDGERGYQQGHSIALYIRMRFGEDAFASFANEHDKAWRAHWETIIEEKLGVTGEQLYNDWKAWVEDYYQRIYGDLVAEGEVKGVELSTASVPWDFDSPADRDAFYTEERRGFLGLGKKRKVVARREVWEGKKDSSGRYDVFPRMSDDGKWLAEAYAYGSVTVSQTPELLLATQNGGVSGRPENAEMNRERTRLRHSFPVAHTTAFDFVPGKDQLVVTMFEDQIQRSKKRYNAIRIETDGYEWNKLVVLDLATRTETLKQGDGEIEVETLRPKKQKGSGYFANYRQKPGLSFTEIDGTQRGTDPAVSPDGTKVAYVEYGDGTHNLVVIGIDGSDKTYLTEFKSGEMIQSVDWSPDGTQLVFALFKNYQGDLWFYDLEEGEATPLNQDASEELDPHWSVTDGKLYFSSDVNGIYNIYRYTPETRRVHQLTNVITTAYTPWVTPSGDLMYMNVTAFGEKNFIVARDEFLETDVTDKFGLDYDVERAKANYAYTEDLSRFEELTRPYQGFARFHPPAVIPIFQVRNPSLPTWGFNAGVQVSSFDVGEKHEVLALALAGTNFVIGGGYTYRGWYPEISIFVQHAQSKSDLGFLIDNDNNQDTKDDQEIYEFRQNSYQNAVFLQSNYPLNQTMQITGGLSFFEFGFRGQANQTFQPFIRSAAARLGFEFSNLDFGIQVGRLMWSPRGINPRGRYVTMNYAHGLSDTLSPSDNGYSTDDGERLDKYQYNSLALRWTEHASFPVPSLARKGHRLQVDVQASGFDRNVQLFDEFRGGGGHPLAPGVGNGAVQPTAAFSGYPAVLLGETMASASAAWRMPVIRNFNEKLGPLYLRDVYFQFGGSAGNFWSFRPPEEEGSYYRDNQGNRIAYDAKDVKREIPFVDTAYKNGNYLLTDVSAEFRVSSLLLGNAFNSILRVSYGFQEVSGVFDINGDDINDSTNNGFGNAISVETEKPGPRIYLGIGSGW